MQSIWREDMPLKMNPFGFFLFVSRPYRLAMVGALSTVVIAATLSTSSSYVFKMIVNSANALRTGNSPQELWASAFLYVLVSFASFVVWRASGFIGAQWTTGVRATARYALSSYVSLHSTQYFSSRFAGSIGSKITHAANSARDMTEQILWQFTGFLVTMLSSFALLLYTNVYLALIFLGWVCFITPLNIYFARNRLPISAAYQKAETVLVGATVDMLTNMPAVDEYANRTLELKNLQKLIYDRQEKGLRNVYYAEKVLSINGVLEALFIGGLLLTAIHLVAIGILSPGDIALVLTLILLVQDRLTFIGRQLNEFAEAWSQVSESLEDILVPQEVTDDENAKLLEVRSASITLDNASFTYGNTSVFHNLSLVIPRGQKVGLVGRSGAGKSTLVKLLLRHYDLTSGSIKIGDENIAAVTKESLRRAIAVVPQEPLLFHRSIRDNIAYGKPDATMEEVIRAATLAEAHAFITQVPEGYDALVGERGVKLSGGQRQRIVIARAILKDAPILLLDEATSALDSESEGAVQKALFTLMEHRTVIAVAHRLSTLRAMDRIIVMDEGTIIEDGTHDELLAKDGVYAMLWNHQAGGFIEE
jgi:ATP-binding cassette, subfamily B, bacterial